VRLQLMLALALALVPRLAWADQVVGKVSTYTDDDHTAIRTGLVDGDVTLGGGLGAGAHVLVDSISSASVDVISAATPGFEETRVETGARARLVRRAGEVALAYVRSTENDWTSQSGQLTLARDLAHKNARLELGYGYTTNTVGRSGDEAFCKSLAVHTVEASVSQILDEKTLVALSYTFQAAEGFQSSPYRYVWVMGVGFLETHPSQRMRHALTLRALRYLAGAGLEATYRLYLDDWGIVSHTATASATVELGQHWALRVRGRGYYQQAADFWRETYDMPMAYMSADREVATFWNLGGGFKLSSTWGGWTVDAKVDAFLYRFLDFARLDGRTAVVGDLGVAYTW
jgi:hypothetical protein